MLHFRLLCLALTVLFLGACGHTPVTRTLFDAIPGLGKSVDDLELDPKLRYLRVTVRGRAALLVLGYVEPDSAGEIETWYSSQGEVIRLQGGRIVGTAGLETNWREVSVFSPPTWKDMPGRSAVVYRRKRDEMPGYRYGIEESVSLYPVRVPYNAKLVRLPAQGLQWYEETVVGKPDVLPSARFAVQSKGGEPRVVYSEQCLSQTLCIAWQLWPVTQ